MKRSIRGVDSGEPPLLRRFRRGFRWDQVELEPYKLATHRGGEFRGASRQVLVGKRGERVKFHVRYFELEPRGFTSLECHRHSHVVIGVRGRGEVRVGTRRLVLRPLDTIYIGPGQPHQLSARGRAPFGFFCIVDAIRDRPRPVEERKIGRK
jgi:quercetin dioxygenase-like cupin family protein